MYLLLLHLLILPNKYHGKHEIDKKQNLDSLDREQKFRQFSFKIK